MTLPRRLYPKEFKINAVHLVQVEGRRACDVADELVIGRQTLYSWLDEARTGALSGTSENAHEITSQEAEIARLKSELDRPQVRYAFLLKTLPDPDLLGIPITERCRILGVSPSGYYEWRNRQLGCPRQKTYQAKRSKINNETIVMTIRRIRKDLGYTPGYRQFHALLRRCGIHVGLKRLQRTLLEHGYIGYRTIADLTKRLTAITV